jgi:DNA-binding NarL/FixJ family response regulator
MPASRSGLLSTSRTDSARPLSSSKTRSERRIADLAAAGRLNRQIADDLVATVATVEYHLRQA